MSDRIGDADFMVAESKQQLAKIRGLYARDLQKKNLSRELKNAIKTLLDNLRSALDYYARELYERFVPNPTREDWVYFPIVKRDHLSKNFLSVVGNKIPRLHKVRPELVAVLASFQVFSDPANNAWMSDFATLSNENKHERLSPQSLEERGAVSINGGGVVVGGRPGSKITLAAGSIINGTVLMEDTTIGVGLPPPPLSSFVGPTVIQQHLWAYALFADIHQEVISFLQRAVDGVEKITLELKKHL